MKLVQVIKTMRKQQKISQSELCRGLCSVSVLSRIEKGEKQGDRMLLEALFERLGTTLLYWEKILNNNDIKLYQMQMQIEMLLEEEQLEQVEILLTQYEDFRGVNEPLHKQYKTWTQARVLQLKGNIKESLQKIKEAFSYTFSEFNEKQFEIKNYYLCYQELQIYFMWLQLEREYRNREITVCLEKLLQYVEERTKDEHYLSQLTPVLFYEIANIKFQENYLEEAYFFCNKGLNIQRKNERLEHLKELLKLKIQIEKKLELEKSRPEIERWYEGLMWLEERGRDLEYQDTTRDEVNIYSIGEIFRNLRKEYQKRQDDFMELERDEIRLVRETISRTENGHKNPTQKTCDRYLQQFDKKVKFYSSRIESDDYEVYILQSLLGKKVKQEEVKEAKKILKELEVKLDLTNSYNVQYIRKEKLFLDFLEGKIEGKVYRKQLIEVLKLSVKNYDEIEKNEKLYGYFNRNEIEIMNNIAISYASEENYDLAIQWYRRLFHYFEKEYNRVGYGDYIMLLTNYVSSLGNNAQYQESNYLAKKGIYISIKNKDASFLSHLLYEIAWNYKEESKVRNLLSEEKKLSKIAFKMSYEISQIFEQHNMITFLNEQIKEITFFE